MLNRCLLAACAFLVLLAGCAAPGPKFSGLKPVANDKANVYVYRQSALFAIAQSFTVDVDKKPVGEIFNASYLMLEVPAGKHVIGVRPGLMAPHFAYSVTADAGKNYFLEFDMNSGPLANLFFVGSEIKQRDQAKAMNEMAEMKSAKQ